MPVPIVCEAVVDLIVGFETGGRDGYSPHPEWPGGASGVTIGVGWDAGYEDADDLTREWGNVLPAASIAALGTVLGLKGGAAQAALPGVAHVVVSWDAAISVFRAATLPRYAALTARAFPGSADLSSECFGALVSLVYNRGTRMKSLRDDDDERREMRAIRQAIVAGDLKAVPVLIRAMKRLWIGKGMAGLLDRREREAALFELGLNR